MRLFIGFLALIAVATFSFSASAGHKNTTSYDKHGEHHHTHHDGDWHGVEPHKHGGEWMHRGHTHTHKHEEKKCEHFVWHNNTDLNKWRAKYGRDVCYHGCMNRKREGLKHREF